ncbi:recombinase family protein [Amycolatopsis mediterranei]|uniref:recombinase family protein n=1 Tax=Amycolatopsis mediterranei TaxID=33910 RepID=UPI00342C91CA
MPGKLERQRCAVMYLRIASSRTEDATTLDLQRDDCKRIAEKYGLQIVREYADAGVPAVLDRQTSLQHLLEDLARQRDAAYVVMWDYSRIGRTMDQLDEVVRRLADAGATIATITGVETVDRFLQNYRDTPGEPPP